MKPQRLDVELFENRDEPDRVVGVGVRGDDQVNRVGAVAPP